MVLDKGIPWHHGSSYVPLVRRCANPRIDNVYVGQTVAAARECGVDGTDRTWLYDAVEREQANGSPADARKDGQKKERHPR
jgi:hypothetical protein